MFTYAIVGRPNVGKSTLFNRLTKTRNALVADTPGVTRDRQYGEVDGCNFRVIDTGGIVPNDSEGFSGSDVNGAYLELITHQAQRAVDEADCILLVMDAQAGVTLVDSHIINIVRRHNKPCLLIVNKIDGVSESVWQDFYQFGLEITAIAAVSRRGVEKLRAKLTETAADYNFFAETDEDKAIPITDAVVDDDLDIGDPDAPSHKAPEMAEIIEFALVGKPNVGKSTLANRILGEDRFITANKSGTTIDSIKAPFERMGHKYMLVDTAGLRRRRNITNIVEKFSTSKTRSAIEQCMVAVLLLDAQDGVSEQDLKVLQMVVDFGKPLVLVMNKWDGLDQEYKQRLEETLERKLLGKLFFNIHYISALHGSGVGDIFASIKSAYIASIVTIDKNSLQGLLSHITERHPPALVGTRLIKIKFARQTNSVPPTFSLFGNLLLSKMTASYVRYMSNKIREALKLKGSPVKIILHWQDNPYQGKQAVSQQKAKYKQKTFVS